MRQCTNTSGVQQIQPPDFPTDLEVYCDMTSHGGAWMLVATRASGTSAASLVANDGTLYGSDLSDPVADADNLLRDVAAWGEFSEAWVQLDNYADNFYFENFESAAQRLIFYNSFLIPSTTIPMPCRYFLGAIGQPREGGTLVSKCTGYGRDFVTDFLGPINDPVYTSDSSSDGGWCWWGWVVGPELGAGACTRADRYGHKARVWVRQIPSPPSPPPPSPPPSPPPPHIPQLISAAEDFTAAVISAISAEGQPVSIHVAPGDHVLAALLIFDASVTASEIWIIGEPGSSLRGEGSKAALIIRDSSPRVHLVGLHLQGLRIISESGDLRIRDTSFGDALSRTHNRGRALDGSDEQPALSVNGGNVDIFRGQFSHFNGGAIAVTSGWLSMDNSTFDDNSAVKGGAILVTGGHAHLKRVLFRRNRARTTGGALQVDGGIVELSDETHFVGNRAPQGASLCACLLKHKDVTLLLTIPLHFFQAIQWM